MLEAGAVPEARAALLRARELLAVLETCPALPESWGPPLLEVIRALAIDRLDQRDPAVWAGVYGKMMSLCGAELARTGTSS